MTKSNLGKKGLLNLTGYIPASKEVRAGTPAGQDLKQKSWRNAVYFLLLASAQVAFLCSLEPGAQRRHCPTVIESPPLSINNPENFPTDIIIGQPDGDSSPTEVSTSQVCQADNQD